MSTYQEFRELFKKPEFREYLTKEKGLYLEPDTIDFTPEEIVSGYIKDYKEYKDNKSKPSDDNVLHQRNRKLYGDIIVWNDDEANIYNDWHQFRRQLYSDIVNTIINMDVGGVENEDEIYRVYSGSSEFKWFNNEYTVYANGRDTKKDEKVCSLAEQFNTIVNTVYNNRKGMEDIGKSAETIWEGKLVGKDVAIDLAIRWERNVWKSTAHLPEQGKFRGRLVTHAEVYAAVYKSMLQAINTGRDLPGATKSAVQEYFTGHNTTGFMDRLQDKMIENMSK